MTMSARCIAIAMLLLTNAKIAHAAFFGTFNDVPEPTTLSVFAVGAGFVVVARYLKSRNRDK